MSTETKKRIADIWTGVVASLVVSVIGGGLSMYIGYRIVESRVAEHERRIAELERAGGALVDRINAVDAKVSDVKADVSYIRGALEGRK